MLARMLRTFNDCLLDQLLQGRFDQVTQQAQVPLRAWRADAELLLLLRCLCLRQLGPALPALQLCRRALELVLLADQLCLQLLNAACLLLVGGLQVHHPLHKLLRPAQTCQQLLQLQGSTPTSKLKQQGWP